MKEWIKRHGGGPFIRALLRAERLTQSQASTTELAPEIVSRGDAEPH
ncbi:hypothetical protein [Dictyobacter kobayashii]|nr:hypothetical protein [Dictyobacter kobayashii]